MHGPTVGQNYGGIHYASPTRTEEPASLANRVAAYVADPGQRIRLHNPVRDETTRLVAALRDGSFDRNPAPPRHEAFRDQVALRERVEPRFIRHLTW